MLTNFTMCGLIEAGTGLALILEILMHAVMVTGGKQYRVSEGDKVRVELLPAAEGSTVEFEQVLLLSDGENVTVGKPYVADGKVTATVRTHGRSKKIRVIKFKRRKGYMRTQGHRQSYTELEITGISGSST